MVQYHLTHAQMDRIPQFSGQGRLVMQDRIIFRDGIAVLVRDLVDQCEVITVSLIGDSHDVAGKLGNGICVICLSHGASDCVICQHMRAGLRHFDAGG